MNIKRFLVLMYEWIHPLMNEHVTQCSHFPSFPLVWMHISNVSSIAKCIMHQIIQTSFSPKRKALSRNFLQSSQLHCKFENSKHESSLFCLFFLFYRIIQYVELTTENKFCIRKLRVWNFHFICSTHGVEWSWQWEAHLRISGDNFLCLLGERSCAVPNVKLLPSETSFQLPFVCFAEILCLISGRRHERNGTHAVGGGNCERSIVQKKTCPERFRTTLPNFVTLSLLHHRNQRQSLPANEKLRNIRFPLPALVLISKPV